MRLVHHYHPECGPAWSLLEGNRAVLLARDEDCGGAFLACLLQWPDPADVLRRALDAGLPSPLDPALLDVPAAVDPGAPHLLPPLDRQEVWAAGVTYLRSKVARMAESEGAARFYDLVYDAERPELFFKGGAGRVVGSGDRAAIRTDASWNVPEPEIGLLLTPALRIAGYTIGNDLSSRDIEGENPLYLPQAKVYARSCALGPAVLIEPEPREHRELAIELRISRGEETVFAGETSSGRMRRTFADLAAWLGRDNPFPSGALLLTGTGLVPGDDFTLQEGDRVRITVPGIGSLENPIIRGAAPR